MSNTAFPFSTSRQSVGDKSRQQILETLSKLGGTEQLRELGPTQFLMPGFIDCHHHAPQYSYAGTATDAPLMQWLEVGHI